MAAFTFSSVADRFPVGTTVTAARFAGSAPITTAVVAASGSLAFTGLADDTSYIAYATVNGERRTVNFKTSRPRYRNLETIGPLTDGDAPVWSTEDDALVATPVVNRTEFDAAGGLVAVYQDFRLSPDGPLTVADTGQEWDPHFSGTQPPAAVAARSAPVIADGRLTSGLLWGDIGGGGAGNAYAHITLDNPVLRIGGRFTMDDTGGTPAGVALLVLEAPITLAGIPSMSVHLHINKDKWTLGYWNGFGDDNTGLVPNMNGYWTTPLTLDGETEYEIEVTLDIAESAALVASSVPCTSPENQLDNALGVHSPDARLHYLADPGFAQFNGPVACWETFATPGNAWKEAWAHDQA